MLYRLKLGELGLSLLLIKEEVESCWWYSMPRGFVTRNLAGLTEKKAREEVLSRREVGFLRPAEADSRLETGSVL